MDIDLAEDSFRALAEHARIPIAFEVASVLELVAQDNGFGGFVLSERNVDPPYTKDYDAIESPADWPSRFDMSNWGLISAHVNGRRVGGAVAAFNTPDLDMLERRNDLVVLWDLRVSTEFRRHGVGRALFRAAEQWAAERECRDLKVETQNINVPACRFYARQGCTLGAINRFAYVDMPDEVQLIWHKVLPSQQ